MTLLIVDDEWYAVKGISQGIDWAQAGVKQVLEAFSAEEARQALCESAVDVMICDIEMPETSGLELAGWCMAHYPAVKIIFLTGHASFPYANEALRLKAFDYVLKPVDHGQLVRLVQQARRQAKLEGDLESDAQRWQQYSARMEAQRPERTRLFWRNVIDNRLGRESIHAWLSMQENNLCAPGLITPAAVWADDGGGTTREETMAELELDEKLDQCVLSRMEGCRLKDPELDTLLLLYGAPPGFADRLDSLLRALNAQMGRRLHWRIGEAAAPEALWWEVRRLRAGTARTLPVGRSAPERFDWESAITDLPAEQVHARADQLFAEIAAQGRPLRLCAESARLRGALLSLADRYGFAPDTVDVILALPDARADHPAFLARAHHALDLAMQEYAACTCSDNAIIARARQYIRTHLDQELTREAVAAHVYLHPAYLSRLFKHETGVTLSDYIAEQRVRAACKLLEAPGIKIGAVAARVGYPQFSYFCRVFRRVMGMSPQEYQQSRAHPPSPAEK